MQVSLISVTKPFRDDMTPEDLMVYTARVSSPQNQENLDTGAKLLRYCIKKKHWSVFAMVDMTVEIVTSRAISAQIIRHKSFDFQEFSQRYAEVPNVEEYEPRRQDTKNRQNSIDDLSDDVKHTWRLLRENVNKTALDAYKEALRMGVAKESARFLLPMASTTRLYMKGPVRSWIHFFETRLFGEGVQKEHRDVAAEIWEIFKEQFPVVTHALTMAWFPGMENLRDVQEQSNETAKEVEHIRSELFGTSERITKASLDYLERQAQIAREGIALADKMNQELDQMGVKSCMCIKPDCDC